MPIKRTVIAVDTTVKRNVNAGSRGYFFAGWCYPVPKTIDDYYVLDEALCKQISDGNLYTGKSILMEHNQMAPVGKILECKYDRNHGIKGALYVKAWLEEGFFKSAEEIKDYKLSISYGVDRQVGPNKTENVQVTPLEISLTKNPEFPTEIVIVHSRAVTMSETSGDSQPMQDVSAATSTPAETATPAATESTPSINFCTLEEIMKQRPADMMELIKENPGHLEGLIRSAAQASREFNAIKESNTKLSKDLEEALKFKQEANRADIERSTKETLGTLLPPEKIGQVVDFFTKHPEHSELSEIFALLAQKKSQPQPQKPRDIAEMMEDFDRTRRSQDQLVAAFSDTLLSTPNKSTTVSHSVSGSKRQLPVADSTMTVPRKLFQITGNGDVSQNQTRTNDSFFTQAQRTIDEFFV